MTWLRRQYARIHASYWMLGLFTLALLIPALHRIILQDSTPDLVIDPSDPDPWVRLVLVRDFLLGGGWYHHLISHSNAPFSGMASAWTRPVDLVIAALTLLHPGHAPLDLKLMHVASLLPVLWSMLLLAGIFRIIRRYCDIAFAYFIAGGLFFALVGARNYFDFGNVDHHAPLTVLWVWVLSYLLKLNRTPRDTAIMGALLGLMLWINPEALLLIGAIFAILGMRWLRDGAGLVELQSFARAVAFTTIAAVAIEYPPSHWLTPIYDSISIVHAWLLALTAMAVELLARRPLSTVRRRFFTAMLAGMVILIAMALQYPLFFYGPFAQVDPFIIREFLPHITEAKPFLLMSDGLRIAQSICPLIAACALEASLRKRSILPRPIAGMLMFLLFFTGMMFFLHVRWFYYFYPPMLMALAIFFTSIFMPHHEKTKDFWPAQAIAAHTEWRQMQLRIGLMLLIIAAPNAFYYWQTQQDGVKEKDACEAQMRRLIHGGALTKALGPEPLILLAPTNLGGSILFFTPYRIIASNYHRDGRAIEYVWHAVKVKKAAEMHDYLARRKVDALFICPDSGIMGTSFLNDLYEGKNSASWLTKIPVSAHLLTPSTKPPQLWKIKQNPPKI